MGVAKPLFDIGSTIWIAERVPFARRARSFGFVEISWAGGLLVGAPMFGWLMERYGWTAPFWVIGLVTAAGTVVLMVIGRGSTSHPTADVGRIKDRLDGEAIAFLLAASIMSMAIELTFVVLGEWLEMGFGLTLLALGGIGIILGIAELVAEGGVLAFTDRMGPRQAMQVGAAGMVVGFGAIAMFDSSLAAGVAAFTFTLLVFEFAIVSALPLATELRPNDRARFLSIYLVVSAGGRVVADWTGPTLFDRGGLATVALVGAGASVVALTLITRWMRLRQDLSMRPKHRCDPASADNLRSCLFLPVRCGCLPHCSSSQGSPRWRLQRQPSARCAPRIFHPLNRLSRRSAPLRPRSERTPLSSVIGLLVWRLCCSTRRFPCSWPTLW